MNPIHILAVRIPSLQTLRAFDAAGRLKSYSMAGEELGLTHSAISHRIRDLEALTGKRLFERQGNRMEPTVEGRHLLAKVRNALGLLESIFVPPVGSSKRVMTISLFPALARWLVPRLAAFRDDNPELDLRLDLSPQPVELGSGIDAAIRYGGGSWSSTDSKLLAGELLFPVCSPEYQDALQLREPADLLRCNLLRHPWHSWAAWFDATGVSAGEPRDGPEYSDSSLLIEAAQAGEGVALARGMGVADRLRDGTLVRPFAQVIEDERAHYLVRPKGRRDQILDEFESWLAGEFRQARAMLEAGSQTPLAPQVPPS